jgi:OPT family small oligopeptide transporter
LDVAQYEQYSPLFLTASYVMVYTTGFALTSSVLVHTALYHGKSLWTGFRFQRVEEDDIHSKLMRKYTEVPEWWYAVVGVVMLALSITAMEVYDTGLPIWALLISIAIPAIYILPAGFIYAMTGQVIGINLISELIAGYAMPGNPVSNQIFKVFALQTLQSGLNFVQDLKLGHYMKVPPRVSFKAQIIFSIWIAIVQVGVNQFMFGNIVDLCSPDQLNKFTCPHARVFFTSSIVWGVIGPKRLFGEEGLYSPLYYAILAGAVLPFPFWFLTRKYPRSWIKFVSVPIILNGVGYIPPASGIVYTSWFATGFVFQYLIRKYNFRWWSKYNFITSAGLDSGTVFSTIVIFLALQLPKSGNLALNWWGNNVVGNNLDAQSIAYLQAPPQGFAPSPAQAEAGLAAMR